MSPKPTKTSNTRILAIETSCDETAITLIHAAKNGKSLDVLSNLVSSQVALHARWGGVVPNLAKREHQKNLPILLVKCLKEAGFSESRSWNLEFRKKPASIPNSKFQILTSILEREPELLKQFQKHIVPLSKPPIDVIAVTQGPGLEPALWVGVNFARALSAWWNMPLIGINHMEGHIYSSLITESRILNLESGKKKNKKSQNSKFQIPNSVKHKHYILNIMSYPALALLVSGGHTELVLIKKPLQYKIIGETRDDAAGEAFDKVARMLGLGYPGGPAIACEALLLSFPRKRGSRNLILDSRFRGNDISLPRPMIHTKDFDFSFSGLKTAVLYLVRDLEKDGADIKKLSPFIAKEFQDAMVDVLVSKTLRAAKQYNVKTVLLGGGVAANISLQKNLETAIKKDLPNSKFYIPDSSVTGDNALMIAAAAIARKTKAKKTIWKTLKPDANMRLC